MAWAVRRATARVWLPDERHCRIPAPSLIGLPVCNCHTLRRGPLATWTKPCKRGRRAAAGRGSSERGGMAVAAWPACTAVSCLLSCLAELHVALAFVRHPRCCNACQVLKLQCQGKKNSKPAARARRCRTVPPVWAAPKRPASVHTSHTLSRSSSRNQTACAQLRPAQGYGVAGRAETARALPCPPAMAWRARAQLLCAAVALLAAWALPASGEDQRPACSARPALPARLQGGTRPITGRATGPGLAPAAAACCRRRYRRRAADSLLPTHAVAKARWRRHPPPLQASGKPTRRRPC